MSSFEWLIFFLFPAIVVPACGFEDFLYSVSLVFLLIMRKECDYFDFCGLGRRVF